MRTIFELNVTELNELLVRFPKWDEEWDGDEDSAVNIMIKKMGITKEQYLNAHKLIKSHRDDSVFQTKRDVRFNSAESFAIFKNIATQGHELE